MAAAGLKPGDQIAVASNGGQPVGATDVSYVLWAPQAFEVWWTELEFFNPASPAARRDQRRRDGLAGRPAREGQLAAGPGRVADRGLEPGRRLGRLAEGLTPPG